MSDPEQWKTLEGLSVSDLANLGEAPENLVWVAIEGVNRNTGQNYSLGFHAEHPTGPYVSIGTEDRSVFLQQATEEETEAALREFTLQLRGLTGGYIDIHPFHGAIWSTTLTPVAPGFGDIASPYDSLLMIINLTNRGAEFDESLTEMARKIGTTWTVPSPKAVQRAAYDAAAVKVNPSQSHRDTAVINNLGEAWDRQFKEYNLDQKVPPAVVLTPRKIAEIVTKASEFGLERPRVSKVNLLR